MYETAGLAAGRMAAPWWAGAATKPMALFCAGAGATHLLSAVGHVFPDDHVLEKADHLGIVALIVATPLSSLVVPPPPPPPALLRPARRPSCDSCCRFPPVFLSRSHGVCLHQRVAAWLQQRRLACCCACLLITQWARFSALCALTGFARVTAPACTRYCYTKAQTRD